MEIMLHRLDIETTPDDLPDFKNMTDYNYWGFYEATMQVLHGMAYANILVDPMNQEYALSEMNKEDHDHDDNIHLINRNHWSILKLPIEFIFTDEDE